MNASRSPFGDQAAAESSDGSDVKRVCPPRVVSYSQRSLVLVAIEQTDGHVPLVGRQLQVTESPRFTQGAELSSITIEPDEGRFLDRPA